MESWKRITQGSINNPIVLIGCGKKKCQRKTKAEWMYQGQFYFLCLSLARLLTNRKNIFILSAKYGLLPLEKEIEPYNLKITSLSKEDKKKWEKNIKKELRKWTNHTIIFICGKTYHNGKKCLKRK